MTLLEIERINRSDKPVWVHYLFANHFNVYGLVYKIEEHKEYNNTFDILTLCSFELYKEIANVPVSYKMRDVLTIDEIKKAKVIETMEDILYMTDLLKNAGYGYNPEVKNLIKIEP